MSDDLFGGTLPDASSTARAELTTMTEQLISTQTVVTFGRSRKAHGYRVHVVGDDVSGYHVQPRTVCGIDFDDATKTVQGFVTCTECAGVKP